jgi:threonine dehydrogenase-like Zn-dependent dehydrogenase
MNAVVVTAPGEIEIRDVPMPTMGLYDALVRIEACSICNATDAKIIERRFVTNIPLPLILGHESVGTILEVGKKVRAYKPGQRVLRPGAWYDLSRVEIGSAWGGLAEYGLVTDAEAWQRDHPGEKVNTMWPKQQVVSSKLDPAAATAMIQLKETLYATRAAGIDDSTWTAIVGTGPVARAFTFWASQLGAPFVVVFGRSERWCHDFLDLGANNFVAGDQPCREDPFKRIGVQAFDRVIEAVGSREAMEDALALIRPNGRVARYGISPEGEHETQAIQKARKAGRLFDLPVREEEVHDEIRTMVSDGEIDLDRWISHRMSMEEIATALELIRSREAVKVAIEMA